MTHHKAAGLMALRAKGMSAPTRAVTRKQFVRAAIVAGMSTKAANRAADICSTMGVSSLIGDVKLSIKKGKR